MKVDIVHEKPKPQPPPQVKEYIVTLTPDEANTLRGLAGAMMRGGEYGIQFGHEPRVFNKSKGFSEPVDIRKVLDLSGMLYDSLK